jgi:hypothetical protein
MDRSMLARPGYNQIAPNGANAFGASYSSVAECALPAGLIEPAYLRISEIKKGPWRRAQTNADPNCARPSRLEGAFQ